MKLKFSVGVALMLACIVKPARAQEVAAYLGFGGAYDGSNGAQIETFGDGTLYKTPSLGGVFGHLGAAAFITKHVGVGAELAWKASQSSYAGIDYRPTLYSFDAIFRIPMVHKPRFVSEFHAGIGGATLRFNPVDDASCAQVPGCPSSHKFQEHLAAAPRWYFTGHFFLRPAFDLHHVHNLSEFGSNWVPQYSVGIGYSVGRKE